MWAYYTQFDDMLPHKRGELDTCVDGEHFHSLWTLPVTRVERVVGGFDQVDMGLLIIRQRPDYETGQMDWSVSIEPSMLSTVL